MKLSDTRKTYRDSRRQQRYDESHKEEISARKAARYLNNQNKKYETGIGAAQIQALHEEDLQKYKAVQEWIAILKVDDDDMDSKTISTLKHTNSNLKVHWEKDEEVIPLRISMEELQSPAMVSLLKFLGMTLPNEDSTNKGKLSWTFSKNWDRCSNGNCKAEKCDSILEMKKRFLQEIIITWNQTEADRGKDQWLDPIDCRGCKYSFKNLMRHLLETKLDCLQHYSSSEQEKIRKQISTIPTLKDRRKEAALKKSSEEKKKQMSHELKLWQEEIRKAYRPTTDEEIHEDIPSYLIPFKVKKDNAGIDNKIGKIPIKVKNLRKYHNFSL